MGSLRDRTSEFNSVAENLKQKQIVTPRKTSSRNMTRSEHAQFAHAASQIGKDIASIYDKLHGLTKLAKTKSLFEDPTAQIQELTNVINQDIKKLNHQITQLQQLRHGRNTDQEEKHSEGVLESLKSQLRGATKKFSEILEVRTENLKNQQKQKESYTGLSSNSFGQRTADSALYKINTHQDQENSNSNSGGRDVVLQMPSGGNNSLMLTQDRMVSSRAEAVVSIERTMVELQGIFRQLAGMVAEQGEMIARIDADITQTQTNVDSARDQLLRYLASVSSNRWLMMKMFFVLIFFVVIFVVFFV